MLKEIISAQNSHIKLAIKLHLAKHRTEFKLFIAEGLRVISTLIDAGLNIEILFITKKHLLATKYIKENNTFLISDSLMQRISKVASPSGMLAIFGMPQSPEITSLKAGIVLAGIQDPGNAGTLIRTAAAMNKKTAIFINSVDPFNPKVVQSSTGAVGLLDIFCISWEKLIDNKGPLKLCALTVRDGQDPTKLDLSNSLIVVGSEGQGISQQYLEDCEQKLTLPMPGAFESLNAGVAGSIALYLSRTN